MKTPVFVDDKLVIGWLDELTKRLRGGVPAVELQRWREVLLDAVREARAPSTARRVVGQFAVIDRYFGGIAAGLAAGLGTSPASDGGDSDPLILVAGLLAGAAAVRAFADAAPAPALEQERRASGAAGAAVVDAAADGRGLVAVIGAASAAATKAGTGSLVAYVLAALAESVGVGTGAVATLQSDGRYEVSLLVDGGDLDSPIGFMVLEQALSRVADSASVPADSGYRLRMTTSNPGLAIETILAFGRIRELRIRFLGP